MELKSAPRSSRKVLLMLLHEYVVTNVFLFVCDQQAKDKKTRKFAAVKRMISPKDMRM